MSVYLPIFVPTSQNVIGLERSLKNHLLECIVLRSIIRIYLPLLVIVCEWHLVAQTDIDVEECYQNGRFNGALHNLMET